MSISSAPALIAAVVADAMCRENPGLYRISFDDIPPSAAYNEEGTRAHCALVLTPEQDWEFDRRVRDLRA